jgi:hypothetical protein
MSAQKFQHLLQLSDAVFESERAALAALAKREEAVRTQLRDLAQVKNTPPALGEAQDTASKAGADVRWHRWIDQRREILNHELAQIMALKLAQQEKLQKAFGRKQATDGLAKRAIAQAKIMQDRRDRYTS